MTAQQPLLWLEVEMNVNETILNWMDVTPPAGQAVC